MANFKNLLNKMQRNFRMKLTWKLRRRIFLQRIGKTTALINASLYIFLFGFLVWGFDKVIPFIRYIQDPSIATLIGAIVGALVGGLFAYMAAVDTHKSELESTAALKRRDEIYRPLYNDVRTLKDKIVRKPNDLLSFLFDSNLNTYLEHSKIWTSTNEDIKRFQVPIDLEKAMIRFRELVESCSKAQKAVSQETVYRDSLDNRVDLLRNLSKEDINEEERLEIFHKLIQLKITISSLDSYKQFDNLYSDLEIVVEDIFMYLEKLIEYINHRYEQRASWF